MDDVVATPPRSGASTPTTGPLGARRTTSAAAAGTAGGSDGPSPLALSRGTSLSARATALALANSTGGGSSLIRIDHSGLEQLVTSLQAQISAQRSSVDALQTDVASLRGMLEGTVDDESAASSGVLPENRLSTVPSLSLSGGVLQQQQQQQLSPTPWANLPPALRSSFDFLRREMREQQAAAAEYLGKKIETAVSKAVCDVMEQVQRRMVNAREETSVEIEHKTSAVTRALSERVAELSHSLLRQAESSTTAEGQLSTSLAALTQFAQKVEKRCTERLDSADARANDLSAVLQQHMAETADLRNRLTPLVGTALMDDALGQSGRLSGPTSPSASQNAGHKNDQQQRHQQLLSSAIPAGVSSPESLGGAGASNSLRGRSASTGGSPPTMAAAAVVPTSLAGAIDVEVLAAHDPRAIAMLATAPFIALRHQLNKDAQGRIFASRESIVGELESIVGELREEIAKRPLPARVVEMVRDLTSDKSIQEQLRDIRNDIGALDVAKVSHAYFTDALKTKADGSALLIKADADDVNMRVRSVANAVEDLRGAVASVQTERAQFRSMLREVLFMHRRANALSGGGEADFGATNDFLGGDNSNATAPLFVSGVGGSPQHTNELAGENAARGFVAGARVRDPRLPLVQQQSAYEALAEDPRRAGGGMQASPPGTAAGSPRSGRSFRGTANNNGNGNAGLARQASQRRAGPTASASASSPRRAQQIVDGLVAAAAPQQAQQQASASPRSVGGGGSINNRPTAEQFAQQSAVGSRDMSQQAARKVFTPNTGGAPPLDL